MNRRMFIVQQDVQRLFGQYLVRALVFAVDEEAATLAVLSAGSKFEACVKRDRLSFTLLPGPAPKMVEFHPAHEYGNSVIAIFETAEDPDGPPTEGDESEFECGEEEQDDDEGDGGSLALI